MAKKFLQEGGYGRIEEPVVEVARGEFRLTRGKLEFQVIACRHCHAVIQCHDHPDAIVIPKYRCNYCDGPICKYCAENLDGARGMCFPWDAQVEYKRKYGVYPHQVGVLDFRKE